VVDLYSHTISTFQSRTAILFWNKEPRAGGVFYYWIPCIRGSADPFYLYRLMSSPVNPISFSCASLNRANILRLYTSCRQASQSRRARLNISTKGDALKGCSPPSYNIFLWHLLYPSAGRLSKRRYLICWWSSKRRAREGKLTGPDAFSPASAAILAALTGPVITRVDLWKSCRIFIRRIHFYVKK